MIYHSKSRIKSRKINDSLSEKTKGSLRLNFYSSIIYLFMLITTNFQHPSFLCGSLNKFFFARLGGRKHLQPLDVILIDDI